MYTLSITGVKICVITEADRSSTCVLLPEANCHHYLWSTNNFLEDALRVMDFWGFEYRTMITWAKDRIGLGQYFRGQTEHVLFGVCGNLPYKVLNGKRQQGTTLIVAPRQEHSKKPASARAMIERVSYTPRIEYNLPLLFGGSIDAWFLAHVASCF